MEHASAKGGSQPEDQTYTHIPDEGGSGTFMSLHVTCIMQQLPAGSKTLPAGSKAQRFELPVEIQDFRDRWASVHAPSFVCLVLLMFCMPAAF